MQWNTFVTWCLEFQSVLDGEELLQNQLYEYFLLDTNHMQFQGGPGGILLTIDGEQVPLDKWKCNKLNTRGQNPEDVYPGSLGNDFDDSAWGNAVPVVSDIVIPEAKLLSHFK